MRKRPEYITVRMLQSRGACREGVEVFKQAFPSGRAKVTLANLNKIGPSHSLYLGHFLSGPEFATYSLMYHSAPAYREFISYSGELSKEYLRLHNAAHVTRLKCLLKVWRGR